MVAGLFGDPDRDLGDSLEAFPHRPRRLRSNVNPFEGKNFYVNPTYRMGS